MPISIKIKGNPDTDEYRDAQELRQLFEKSLNMGAMEGEILIISNATLFGQETKDIDLIVIGSFDRCRTSIKTKAVGPGEEELPLQEREIWVNNFCFVIETKRHRAEDLRLDGIRLLVKYNNKYSDVTTQSENQKYSLKGFFDDRLPVTPYIANFIWFRNVGWESIKSLMGDNERLFMSHNYLPNVFSFRFLLQLACVQKVPYNAKDTNDRYKDACTYNCLFGRNQFDFKQMDIVFNLFERVKDGVGQITRKKIEQITTKLLEGQQYAQAIGDKLIVISGRAGTGKTVKLLRIACDLAISKGARSLILTYNHALVSDIKRILALTGMPDGVDNYTVYITTLHKFIYDLIIGFGLVKNTHNPFESPKYIPDFIEKYPLYLKELVDCIEVGLIQQKEIQLLMKSKHDKVAWDYILIDESQDWDELEKKIIYTVFGFKKTIIADGVDQLIRSQKKCNWIQGLKTEEEFKKTYEKKSLRQQVNVISFVNEYARLASVNWEVEPKQELMGGKIIICTRPYFKELHDEQLQKCKDNGNAEYEMMFLVPPNLVSRKFSGEETKRRINREFILTKEFNDMGIDIWDGTNTDLRTQYPVELTQHRLFQYDSCRGLEGWVVVCLELDEFIRYKFETFTEDNSNDEFDFKSFSNKRKDFVYLWSLIPLTRAIDTLVITIKDKNSECCQFLRKAYERYPDCVEWIE